MRYGDHNQSRNFGKFESSFGNPLSSPSVGQTPAFGRAYTTFERLKDWRKSHSGKPASPAAMHGSAYAHASTAASSPLQCNPNAIPQQRDISDPRSLAYHANKYSVSDNASIIRRERPSTATKRQGTYSENLTYRPKTTAPTTTPRARPISTVSTFSLTPTAAEPSITAQSIPCDTRPFSEMHRTNTNTSTRSRTSYIPQNPVSAWDDDEDEPKRGLFGRFKTSTRNTARKISSSGNSVKTPSIKAPSVKASSQSVKSMKLKPTKSKSKNNMSNKFGIDGLGDFEWNMAGYMEGDEEGSDAEIEAALKKMRQEEEATKQQDNAPVTSASTPATSETTSTSSIVTSKQNPISAPTSNGSPELRSSARVSRSSPTPTPESSAPLATSSPVLPPLSPSQSLDIHLPERFENELKPSASPNYARDHVANILRRRANSGNPAPAAEVSDCPWDSWKYSSNTYQITPPDSTRSSHVYPDYQHSPHHSMVLPESPVQLQPMSTSSSSSSDQNKWDDISANIALIQQQIQEMSPRSREIARGYAAKELTKPATLITPTQIQSPTFATPPRPSRDNVELPECLSVPYLTMTSSPSVRPLPRRVGRLGPQLEESDSADSSQRSSVSTRLSTAPSSPEPDMRAFEHVSMKYVTST